MKHVARAFVPFLFALFLFAGAASAHVTVSPPETTQGKYEVFTVRVPSEHEASPTIKVELKIPPEVNITRFEPKPGWKYELARDSTGKITGVTWTATEGGLSPTEFAQFTMQGKVADDAEEIVWKAYQTYGDGTVVEWVGTEGSETPASVTKVLPKDGNTPGDGHEADGHGSDGHGADGHGTDGHEAAPEPGASPASGTSNVPLYLSIAALAASLLSVFLSLRKRA